jgi:hypothetical protein
MAAAFKIVAPVLKALDDRHKLLVRSGIIDFCALKLLRVKSNRVPFLSVGLEL